MSLAVNEFGSDSPSAMFWKNLSRIGVNLL